MANNPFGFTVQELMSRDSGAALQQARNAAWAAQPPQPKREGPPPKIRSWHASSTLGRGNPEARTKPPASNARPATEWGQFTAWLDQMAGDLAARMPRADIAPPTEAELKALRGACTRLRQQFAANLKHFEN